MIIYHTQGPKERFLEEEVVRLLSHNDMQVDTQSLHNDFLKWIKWGFS